MKSIKLDVKTRETLIGLHRARLEIDAKMSLIGQTVLNVKEVDGEYVLSQDFSELVLNEKTKTGDGG